MVVLVAICLILWLVVFKHHDNNSYVLQPEVVANSVPQDSDAGGGSDQPAPQSPSTVLFAPCTAKMTNAQAVRMCRDAIRQNPAFRGKDVFITGYKPVSVRGYSGTSGVLQVTFLQWDSKDTPATFLGSNPEAWALSDVPKSASGPMTLLISYRDEACGAYMVDALAAADSTNQDWCMDYKSRVLATCNQKDAPNPPPVPTPPPTPVQPTVQKPFTNQACANFWADPDWRTIAQSPEFIDTYVRKGKWRGSDPLSDSVSITWKGFGDKWELSPSLRADDISGFATNHGTTLKYQILDPATQKPPANLEFGDGSGWVSFHVLATLDNSTCDLQHPKILLFSRYS